MWTIFNVFIEFVTVLLLLHLLAPWPWGTWDPSCPARVQTLTPALEGEVPTTGPPGMSLERIVWMQERGWFGWWLGEGLSVEVIVTLRLQEWIQVCPAENGEEDIPGRGNHLGKGRLLSLRERASWTLRSRSLQALLRCDPPPSLPCGWSLGAGGGWEVGAQR